MLGPVSATTTPTRHVSTTSDHHQHRMLAAFDSSLTFTAMQAMRSLYDVV